MRLRWSPGISYPVSVSATAGDRLMFRNLNGAAAADVTSVPAEGTMHGNRLRIFKGALPA